MLLVTNDHAGRTEETAVASAVAELERAGPVEVFICREESDIDTALGRLNGRTLVVVGGDGSLHTAVGRLWAGGLAAEVTVGLIPLGTGNDFARGVGIPLDPVEAARLIVDGTPRPVDLITDDTGDVVVNAAHVGVGAEAAVNAKPLKPYLRILSFPIGGLLAGVRTHGWRLRIVADGQVLTSGRRRVLMAGLSNAPSIAGGTAVMGPDASVTDGVFDVTVSLAVRPLAKLGYAVGLIRGVHPGRDDVIYRTAKTLTINGEPFRANADGEVTGPIRHRAWTIRPGAWRCVLPAGYDA
jgi:diacylglycerol kinase (ATP)